MVARGRELGERGLRGGVDPRSTQGLRDGVGERERGLREGRGCGRYSTCAGVKPLKWSRRMMRPEASYAAYLYAPYNTPVTVGEGRATITVRG